jgi:hypothetical protein
VCRLHARRVCVADRLSAVASGLLYIAEVIEEHSRLAKTIATRAIYVRIYVHIILVTRCLFIPARTHAADHRLARRPLFLRLAPPHAPHIWHRMPHRLPTKYRSNMAAHLPLLADLHCELRLCPRRPLSLVLLLCQQV